MTGRVPTIRARWLLEPGAGLLGLVVVGGSGLPGLDGLPGAAVGPAALGLLLLVVVGIWSFVLGRRHRTRAMHESGADLEPSDVVGVALLVVALGVASGIDSPQGPGRLAWPLFGAVSVAVYARCLYRVGGQGRRPAARRVRVTRGRTVSAAIPRKPGGQYWWRRWWTALAEI